MQLTVPVAIAALLPWLALALSSWLSNDGLQPGINALIALLAILGAAIGCFLLAGNFTGNWAESVLAVLGYVGILLNGDLATLRDYLFNKRSPTTPDPINANPVRVPSALVLPPGAPSVPPRASAQQPDA